MQIWTMECCHIRYRPRGHTRELPIMDIQDISYSFEKTIKTQDISIDNYQQFLNPADTTN